MSRRDRNLHDLGLQVVPLAEIDKPTIHCASGAKPAIGMIERAPTMSARTDAQAAGGLNLALAHFGAGRLAEAEALCQAALMLQPRQAQALQILGGIAMQRGNPDAAIEHFRRAIAAAPRAREAHSNLAAALLAKDQVKQAIAALKQAIKIDPTYAPALINMGDALLKIDRYREAAATLKRAVVLQPGNAKAYTNLGAALMGLKDFDGAIQALQKAISLSPDLAQAHDNLGTTYHALGRLEEAVACHHRALELLPSFPKARAQRGMLHLVQGRFAEGWRDYLDRPSVRTTSLTFHRQPLGMDLSGMRILLGKDQGLGDEIMFLRFAPELKRRGAHITYVAGAKIQTILQRYPILDVVVDTVPGDKASLAQWDIVVSVGDLPYLFGAAEDPPPSIRIPVLPDRLAAQQAALAAMGPPPYVGVTWRGGINEKDKLFKLAPMERIGAVLRQVRGTLIGLQRLPEKGEINRMAKVVGRPVHDVTPLHDRLEDMLALLSQVDEYVGVSNTNVHLRALTGRSSRVLIPSPPEFRWMATGSTSPWFPDCPIYRQEAGGSWDNALSDLARDLATALGSAAP
jgi:tetratricopeptide (TPR) repeat protein